MVVNQSAEFIYALEKSGVRVGLADAYFYRARGYLAQEELELAQQALTQAHQVAERLQARRIQWQILLHLAELEDRFGNKAAASRLRQEARVMLDDVVENIPEGDMQTSFMALPEVSRLLFV